MKKTLIALTLMVMTLFVSASFAVAMPDYAHYYATLNQWISSRTGPGTRYDEDAFSVMSIGEGTTLRILSRSYDEANRRWWVQTEITYQGRQYRIYTGEQRFSFLDMDAIPVEYQLGECTTGANGVYDCYAGPGSNFMQMPGIAPYTACAIWGYEENDREDRDYIQVEYYDYSAGCYRRCWCAEWWMENEYMYYGWPSSQQDSTPQADDWNDSWQSSTSYASDWPVGTTCCVCSTSGNVRSGPSVDCDRVGYVNQGQEFEVLDISVADTGKDWYLIKGYFGEGWVSSGIVSVWLNGERYDLGTINRIPITN